MRLAITLAAALTLALAGCGQDHDAGHDDGGNHDIKARHGGDIVHLADHGPVIEIVHDAKAGTIKLYGYDAHGKAQKLDKAPAVKIEKGRTKVVGKGAGDTWTFTHENLKGHPHTVFEVPIGGRTYQNDTWHPAGDD